MESDWMFMNIPAKNMRVPAKNGKESSHSGGYISAGEMYYILTDVPKVYINFRKPDERALDSITLAQARQYLAEGQFAEGSMAPKVRAGVRFVESTGGRCVITEAGSLGTGGTEIIS